MRKALVPGLLLALVPATGVTLLPKAATLVAAADTPQVVRFHGGGYDQASAVTTDAAGNAYVAGTIDGNGSTFGVVKMSPQGTVVWVARYNGSAGGVGGGALAVAVDGAGNVYAAGFTGDGVIFNTNIDQLVVKFASNGAQQWVHRYDGPARGFDQATEIAVDGAGNAYVAGFAYGENQNQAFDWTTAKFDPAGALLWRRTHSGPGTADDRVVDMALAPSGGVVVTGFTKNLGDGMTNDIDTLAYDPGGNVRWQARWTATPTNHDTPADIDVDAAGRLAITGTTADDPGPYAVPSAITLRYDATGALLQTLPGVGGTSIDLDGAGNIVAAGFFVSPPGTSSVTRLDASGQQTWSTPLTLADDSALSGLSVGFDPSGPVMVASTVINVFTHDRDYLTIRFDADGAERWRHQFDGPIHGDDRVAGLAVDGTGVAWVTGTSWNNYLSIGGTADDIVSLRFPPGSQPALVAPSGLDAQALSRSQIRLRWQDNAGTETGTRIERCTGVGCTNFMEIATVGINVTEHVDGNLARNTQYTYRVRAFNAQETSPYSNTTGTKTLRR